MKNLILCFIFVVAGALLFSVTNGFSKSSYCALGPDSYDCARCHNGNTYCDQCPSEPSCNTNPTPTCTDNDGDGYGNPGDSSCSNGSATDCDDSDQNTYPGAFELCDDGVDNDCDGKADCDDSSCFADSFCLADSCVDYNSRGPCKNDPRCDWSGKEKSCSAVSDVQADCRVNGGRWSKKKADCIYR